jgi:hypothetical protein
MTQPQTNAQLAYSLSAVSSNLRQIQSGLASGELRMDDQVGPTLSAALEAAATMTATLLYQVATISTPAHLGANAVSTSMTGKFVHRATGDGAALAPMLKQYQGALVQAKSAVDAALANFRATDGSISSDLAGR